MNIKNELEKLSLLLKNNSLITDVVVDIGSPAEEDYYDIIELQLDIDARKWFSEIHNQADGVSIFWKYKDLDGYDLPGGEIRIKNLLGIFDDASEVLSEQFAYQDDWPDKVKAIVHPLRPLDIYQEAIDGMEFVAVDLFSHKEEQMWIWTLDMIDRYLLDLKLDNYLQMAFEAKGCVFWQYFFVDTVNMDFNNPMINEYFADSYDHALHRMDYSLNIMNTVFPNEDFTIFEERYKKIKKLEERQQGGRY